MKYGKGITLLACVIGLGGCETMLPHYKVNDEFATTLGKDTSTAQTCAEMGGISPVLLQDFEFSVSRYLSATVYSKEAFNSGMEMGAQSPKTDEGKAWIKDMCESPKVRTILVDAINYLNREYVQIQGWKSQAYAQLERDIDSSTQALSTYSYESRPIQTPEVTFGQQTTSETQHYLINTPNGQRQCSVSDSGYVHCN